MSSSHPKEGLPVGQPAVALKTAAEMRSLMNAVTASGGDRKAIEALNQAWQINATPRVIDPELEQLNEEAGKLMDQYRPAEVLEQLRKDEEFLRERLPSDIQHMVERANPRTPDEAERLSRHLEWLLTHPTGMTPPPEEL